MAYDSDNDLGIDFLYITEKGRSASLDVSGCINALLDHTKTMCIAMEI
jgi:hypothetical protein